MPPPTPPGVPENVDPETLEPLPVERLLHGLSAQLISSTPTPTPPCCPHTPPQPWSAGATTGSMLSAEDDLWTVGKLSASPKI